MVERGGGRGPQPGGWHPALLHAGARGQAGQEPGPPGPGTDRIDGRGDRAADQPGRDQGPGVRKPHGDERPGRQRVLRDGLTGVLTPRSPEVRRLSAGDAAEPAAGSPEVRPLPVGEAVDLAGGLVAGSPEVRPLSADEAIDLAGELAALTRAAYTGSDPLPGLPVPDGARETAAVVHADLAGGTRVLAAFADDVLVGALRVREWEIGRVSVLPALKGTGVAR